MNNTRPLPIAVADRGRQFEISGPAASGDTVNGRRPGRSASPLTLLIDVAGTSQAADRQLTLFDAPQKSLVRSQGGVH
jgi:hypothetical protein